VFKRLALLESDLSELNVKIVLGWIPGHQGIELNEFADLLAKEAARDIYTGRLSAPSFVTDNDAAKIAADITRKSWQRKWDQDVCGSNTRQLIPEVGSSEPVFFPQKRDTRISYCRLLVHDTMLRDDSHRTGTADSPVCECGSERKSAEHFLLRCIRFQDAKNKLIDTVNEISDLSARKRRLQLSQDLLLAPMSVGVTRSEDKDIKAALFQFISETEVKV